MHKIYFVFEHDIKWYLKGIYDLAHFEVYLYEIRKKAEEKVLQNLSAHKEECASRMPIYPVCPPDLSKQIKDKKKLSNQYRLDGNFDAFVAINAEIRSLNQLAKEKKAYDKAMQQYRRAQNLTKALGAQYEKMVQAEIENTLSDIMVFSSFAHVELDKNVLINVYRTSSEPHAVEYVDFTDKLTIHNYPSFIRVRKNKDEQLERHDDAMRHATKHYNARKFMLDNCKSPKDSLDFKKTFKLAVDAYYRIETLKRAGVELRESCDNVERKVREEFKTRCFTIKAPLNKRYLDGGCITSECFTTQEIRQFGERIPLQAEELVTKEVDMTLM